MLRDYITGTAKGKLQLGGFHATLLGQGASVQTAAGAGADRAGASPAPPRMVSGLRAAAIRAAGLTDT